MTSDAPTNLPPVIGVPRTLPIVWQDRTDPRPIPVNTFVLQFTPDGLLFVGGFVQPPIFSGTTEEQQEGAGAVTSMTVEPSVRLLIAYHHLRPLAAAFQQAQGTFETLPQLLTPPGGVAQPQPPAEG